MEEHEDLEWQDIVMPIDIDRFSRYLQLSNYPQDKSQDLIQGFRLGFDIGYRGPENRTHEARNIPLKIGSQAEMWNKVIKEVELR